MTEIEAYQEYIRIRHNAVCKAVIRHAAIGENHTATAEMGTGNFP